ncbi:hypothetical protein LDENG_00251260 [Lucifuga dentata]|nr:hypothetical protein LDENG_00251260 [Lucifuga dentata]
MPSDWTADHQTIHKALTDWLIVQVGGSHADRVGVFYIRSRTGEAVTERRGEDWQSLVQFAEWSSRGTSLSRAGLQPPRLLSPPGSPPLFKLRLPRDRIVLLHEDRQLSAGKLLDLGVGDESKLTLVPAVEAGLCQTTRTDKTLMDVLESLTEAQINDFLSGSSPLTINLGIGAHVLYVQLQLGAQNVAELQQQDPMLGSSSKLQSDLPEPGNMTCPGPAKVTSPANTTHIPTLLPAQTLSLSPNSTSPIQVSTQKPRASFNLAAPTFLLSSRIPAVACHDHSSPHHSCPVHSVHTSTAIPSASSLAPDYPHPSFPPQPVTPVCFPSYIGSSPGPPSPALASTFKESNGQALSSAELYQQPGAVIESFVNHSPGIFTGTFSGTLAPCSQSTIGHPRHGITIILQILNDLLRATFSHQRAPPTLSQLHCPAPNLPVSPSLKTEDSKEGTKPLATQTAESLHFSKTADQHEMESCPSSPEENQTLQSKLEHLRFMMHQRRLRRRTRNSTHLSQTSHLYQQKRHHPWLCRCHRIAHCNKTGCLQTSRNVSPDDQKLRFTEEPQWKPELNSDLVVV